MIMNTQIMHKINGNRACQDHIYSNWPAYRLWIQSSQFKIPAKGNLRNHGKKQNNLLSLRDWQGGGGVNKRLRDRFQGIFKS